MAASTRLTVPSTCLQSWQAMTPDQQGRFCTRCQKTVVDFTAMTDTGVLAHLQQTDEPGCGRFRPDQLNRTMVEPLNRRVSRWQWASLLLAGWLSSQAVQAQSGRPKTSYTILPRLVNRASLDTSSQGLMPDGTMILKGRVIDIISQQPLVGANVVIKNTSYRTTTDSTGAFRLAAQAVHVDSAIQLVTSSIAFVNQELTVTAYMAGQSLLFGLHEASTTVDEIVCTGGYVAPKSTF